jgi:hypothetical protein
VSLPGVVWLILSTLIVVLLGVAYWTHAPAEQVEQVETFIVENNGVLIGLGTVSLLSFIAFQTQAMAGKSADRREKFTRNVESQIKIAEFRQAWINDLRDDLADYLAKKAFKDGAPDHVAIVTLSARIRLRVNPEETPTKALLSAMNRLDYSSEDVSFDQLRTIEDFLVCSQKLLKHEWSRLKDDLKKAQNLEEVL